MQNFEHLQSVYNHAAEAMMTAARDCAEALQLMDENRALGLVPDCDLKAHEMLRSSIVMIGNAAAELAQIHRGVLTVTTELSQLPSAVAVNPLAN